MIAVNVLLAYCFVCCLRILCVLCTLCHWNHLMTSASETCAGTFINTASPLCVNFIYFVQRMHKENVKESFFCWVAIWELHVLFWDCQNSDWTFIPVGKQFLTFPSLRPFHPFSCDSWAASTIYWSFWQFINNATNLILQTGLHITQSFFVTKSVTDEVFDTAFAWLIFHY